MHMLRKPSYLEQVIVVDQPYLRTLYPYRYSLDLLMYKLELMLATYKYRDFLLSGWAIVERMPEYWLTGLMTLFPETPLIHLRLLSREEVLGFGIQWLSMYD